jgi:hypothetical protein
MVEDEARFSGPGRGRDLVVLMALGAFIATGGILACRPDGGPPDTPAAPTIRPPTASAEITPVPATPPPGPPAFPLRVDPTGRYVIDQFGAPWPLVGDAAWSLIGTLTAAQVTWYLDRLEAHDINAILVSLIEGYYSENAPNTKVGEPPYLGEMFQSAPNPAYWAFVDDVVSKAAERGITVLAVPLYVGWADDGVGPQALAASEADIEAYGEFLAQRYESSPNIIWVIGGDKGDINDQGNVEYKKRFVSLASGLRNHSSHLITGHGPHGLFTTYWGSHPSWLDLNNIYIYTHDVVEHVLATGAWWYSPTAPFFWMEGTYESDNTGVRPNSPTRQQLREMMYGTFCAGGFGTVFGNNPRWYFGAAYPGSPYAPYLGTWEETLEDPDGDLDEGTKDLARFAAFVRAASGWQLTVPDTTGTFLTAGEQTGDTRAAARFSTSLGLVYMPTHRKVTLDLTEFAAAGSRVVIRKYDPSDGSSSTIGTYPTSGSQVIESLGPNAEGFGDWVLLVQPS